MYTFVIMDIFLRDYACVCVCVCVFFFFLFYIYIYNRPRRAAPAACCGGGAAWPILFIRHLVTYGLIISPSTRRDTCFSHNL